MSMDSRVSFECCCSRARGKMFRWDNASALSKFVSALNIECLVFSSFTSAVVFLDVSVFVSFSDGLVDFDTVDVFLRV